MGFQKPYGGITAEMADATSLAAAMARENPLPYPLHGMATSVPAAAVTAAMSRSRPAVTDDEFAALNTTERDFALRWVRMTGEEQDWFCRNLLAAIEVLQRLGALEPPQAADGMAPGLPG